MNFEVLNMSHTFSIDDSGVQTCSSTKPLGVTYFYLFDATGFGCGSGEHKPTIPLVNSVQATWYICAATLLHELRHEIMQGRLEIQCCY